MAEHAAVVYDLDGTLIDLDVDWAAVTAAARSRYEQAGVPPPGDLWAMLAAAEDHGVGEDVRLVIRTHECRGARTSDLLVAPEDLEQHVVPVAVCSLNCERACRIALETHGLADAVTAVVGRDTVEPPKPDPAPLVAIADWFDIDPESMLFVGDSRRDARAASAAGVTFRWV